ncbi:MAG: M28 family peptidase [Gilvibacter sp.]
MKAIISILLTVLIFSCSTTVETSVSLEEDVRILASDSLQGRRTGTSYEQMAANYLASRFEGLGLAPKGINEYYQTFSFTPSNDPHQEVSYDSTKTKASVTGTNVIGYLDNQAAKTIVIGAHYDHLGLGGEGSLYKEGEAVHNGADDNASGVAILLKLADSLSTAKTNANYLFIAFSGEELGLLGSNYFVKNPTIDLAQVSYMLNMDMVGRLNKERTLAVYGVGTSPIFKQTLFANNSMDLKIVENESGVGPSDHTSFYLSDIPVLHFFTGQHEDYHKPGDDSEKLNYDGMRDITDYIFAIISDLDTQDKLAFRKTKNESEEVPRFKVGLGVVPDYLFDGEGMRIDGVSEDKPAQKAGLQKGDIVKKLGDSTIVDMMSYMRALSAFKEGESTTVIVERKGEKIEAKIDF